MGFRWIHESPAVWDDGKATIVGGAPPGTFALQELKAGELVPGDWWRVEDQGRILGYGWMDTNWGGDAEVLLAVHPSEAGKGVGTFILDQLEQEAATRGLNYLYNVVRPTHPEGEVVTKWLEKRRFKPSHEGRLLRKVVHANRRSPLS